MIYNNSELSDINRDVLSYIYQHNWKITNHEKYKLATCSDSAHGLTLEEGCCPNMLLYSC